MSDLQPLIAVVGPTGAGKSGLATWLAEKLPGEVINCDSLQVFRGFDIGTAKPPLSERESVPHHLFDIRDPDELFAAGDFARAAKELIPQISARGKYPVICGGTGFYLRALLHGLSPGPQRDDTLRDRLNKKEEIRPGTIRRLLLRLDPEAAARIHPNDKHKSMRALEIRVLTGRKCGDVFSQGTEALTGYRVVQIGLNPPREQLYASLDERCRLMLDSGLLAEVDTLLACWPRSAKPFESLGYKQALQLRDGLLGPEQALLEMQQKTRQYAKRQWTWFRAQPDVVWLDGFGREDRVRQEALGLVRSFLSS